VIAIGVAQFKQVLLLEKFLDKNGDGFRPIADGRSAALGGGDAAGADVLFNLKSYGNFSTTVIQAFIN